MTRFPEKRAIRSAFTDAAPIYDRFASVQRRIASALLERCDVGRQALVLDAGCGTGYLAHSLSLATPGARVINVDLAESMARRAGRLAACGDIEQLPLRDACVDAYLSSLAWQWTDIRLACREAARVLKKDGQLFVASLGDHSLHELRTAFGAADDAKHVRDFHSADDVVRSCLAADLRPVLSRQAFVVHAPDVKTLLHDIRSLGAHVLGARRQGLLGRAAWRRMETAYETFREADGLPITYDVVFIEATKSTTP